MAALNANDVCLLYNYVWMERASLADMGGLCIFAFDSPYTLQRYASRAPGSAIVWAMRFEFDQKYGGQHELMTYQKRGYLRTPVLTKGHYKLKKIDGDVKQFQKDWVIMMMYDHLWRPTT